MDTKQRNLSESHHIWKCNNFWIEECIGGFRGQGGAPHPTARILFNFMHFFGKFGNFICWLLPASLGRLAPPPTGNPGPAPGKKENHFYLSTQCLLSSLLVHNDITAVQKSNKNKFWLFRGLCLRLMIKSCGNVNEKPDLKIKREYNISLDSVQELANNITTLNAWAKTFTSIYTWYIANCFSSSVRHCKQGVTYWRLKLCTTE